MPTRWTAVGTGTLALDLATLMYGLTPGVPWEVSGSGGLTVTDDRLETWTNMVATFTSDTTTVTAPYDVRDSGLVETDGASILVTIDSVDGGWGVDAVYRRAAAVGGGEG